MQGRVRIRLLIAASLLLTATHTRAAGTRSQTPPPRPRPANTEVVGGSRDAVFQFDAPQQEQKVVPQTPSPDEADASPPKPSGLPSKDAARILNINSGTAPRDGRPNGAIGGRHDV